MNRLRRVHKLFCEHRAAKEKKKQRGGKFVFCLFRSKAEFLEKKIDPFRTTKLQFSELPDGDKAHNQQPYSITTNHTLF